MFQLKDYDYALPAERIAQVPARQRDHSRLLLLDRPTKDMKDHHFYDLPDLLLPGDILVVNDTRVVPARLFGRKESGGRVEALVIQDGGKQERGTRIRLCLLKSSKRPKVGSFLFFEGGFSGQVRQLFDNGTALVNFGGEKPIQDLLRESGHMPVPPYIRREDDSCDSLDRQRYQTVYSRAEGAVAAPTAGLHFTVDLLEKLEKRGIGVFPVTLHVGYGTFQPVRTEDIREHELVPERYRIDAAAARAIRACKASGRRVIAVGTTVVRTLESAAMANGLVEPGEGEADLMMVPGFPFRVVDALITNFHLPKSSLLFLVAAFAGLDLTRKAYALAIERKYRFYSYGDAMLIL
jgi:S-adenosylmethionine:tRNA ribosyltransferase-isomerase